MGMLCLLVACGDNTTGGGDGGSRDEGLILDYTMLGGRDLAGKDLSAMAPDLAQAADLAIRPDLTVIPDLRSVPDLAKAPGCQMHGIANATCTQINSWLSEWLACNQTCSSDMSCVILDTHFLPCRNSSRTNASYSPMYRVYMLFGVQVLVTTPNPILQVQVLVFE